MLKTVSLLVATSVAILTACGAPGPATDAVRSVSARPLVFKSYPQADKTYLSFSTAHGYQVNYIGRNGKAWLWYPGNTAGVAEEWKLITASNALCWRHPSSSYNPVTKQGGGSFACQDLTLSRKTIVAALNGDPYNLKSGTIPYRRSKCDAPKQFQFDRAAYSC